MPDEGGALGAVLDKPKIGRSWRQRLAQKFVGYNRR
jgi:hypothetical protein